MTIFVPNINYFDTSQNSVTQFNFTASVDAKVTGFDLDGAFQIADHWNVSAQLSYADAEVEDSQVPCNTFGPGGAPIFNQAVGGVGVVSLCPGSAATRLPLWNATIQSEYSRPIGANAEGFVRGLLTYFPENKNRVEPNFTVPAYGLLNLYAGVRSPDGAWEVALFARNALEAEEATDISPVAQNLDVQLGLSYPQLIRPSGYYSTAMTPRREVGVSLRYAWGSR